MANVIKHKHNDEKVRAGDTVRGPQGQPLWVSSTSYSGKGAAIWARGGQEGEGELQRWAASEVGCYVTSED